jgi:ketosteroid isomerase-like protein
MVRGAQLTLAPAFSIGQERARIGALRERNNAAIAARDVDGITHIVTDDYVMILGGGTVLNGPAAYRDYVAKAFAHPDAMRFVRTPDRIDVGTDDGELVAAESGRWVGTMPRGQGPRLTGRYLVHWTKSSGDWRIASETYVMVDRKGG